MSGIGINPYTALNAIQTAGSKPDVAKPEAATNLVTEGVSGFKGAMEQAEKAAMNTAVSGADPHAMVEALANAELVLDAAVTIRNKVVEAYQELLRMPV
jgi:flagellar hook-basal body complex protein FliE